MISLNSFIKPNKKILRKILKIAGLLALSALLTGVCCLTACSGKTKSVDIGLILTEKSSLNDGTFNQAAYSGIKLYAEEHGVAYKAYGPDSQIEDDYIKAMDTAVKEGAKILVTPGFNFGTSVFKAQDIYPEVKFVLIDGVPNNGKTDGSYEEKIAPNTFSVMFAEEQAGFLAGYAIVKDGFRKLGFLGGRAFPAVVNYGYGFVQGADYAAKELGLARGEVTVKYDYTGNFEKTPENQAKADSWYNNGIEVIFACGGDMGNSVIQSSKSFKDKWVIGVDTDQSGDSETIITSAVKRMENAVHYAIQSDYDGSFPGGQSVHLGADSDGVGLAIDTSRFRTFTKEDYDKIYKMLAENQNNIASSIVKDLNIKVTDIPLEYVVIG